jgi:hypothetical protein
MPRAASARDESARDESRVGIHHHRGHRETPGEHRPLCNPVSPVVKI